jgi:hypothetical protein
MRSLLFFGFLSVAFFCFAEEASPTPINKSLEEGSKPISESKPNVSSNTTAESNLEKEKAAKSEDKKEDSKDEKKDKNKHDNSRLLPKLNLLNDLFFAIPKKFVMESRSKKDPNLEEGVFWGESETLKRYIEGKKPIESSIIFVKLSNSVTQRDGCDFDMDFQMQREWRCLGGREVHIRKIFWGPYPVVFAETLSQGGVYFFVAWVGLNQPDGRTLMFTFLTPDYKNRPTSKELGLWYHFLLNTGLYYRLDPSLVEKMNSANSKINQELKKD